MADFTLPVGQAIGSAFSLFNQRKQNEFNAEEAQKNRDFQRELFDAANAYNDPAAQVQRLRDAGLNPNLALGSPTQLASAQPTTGSQAQSVGRVSFNDSLVDIAQATKLFSESKTEVGKQGLQEIEKELGIIDVRNKSAQVNAKLSPMNLYTPEGVKTFNNAYDLLEYQNRLGINVQNLNTEAEIAALNAIGPKTLARLAQGRITSEQEMQGILNALNKAYGLEAHEIALTQQSVRDMNVALTNLYQKQADLTQQDINHYVEKMQSLTGMQDAKSFGMFADVALGLLGLIPGASLIKGATAAAKSVKAAKAVKSSSNAVQAAKKASAYQDALNAKKSGNLKAYKRAVSSL